MANTRISNLAAADANSSDQFAINQSLSSKSITLAKMMYGPGVQDQDQIESYAGGTQQLSWSRQNTSGVTYGYFRGARTIAPSSPSTAQWHVEYLDSYTPPSSDHVFAVQMSGNTDLNIGQRYGVIALLDGTWSSPGANQSLMTCEIIYNANQQSAWATRLWDSYASVDTNIGSFNCDHWQEIYMGSWFALGWDQSAGRLYAYYSNDGHTWKWNDWALNYHTTTVPIGYGFGAFVNTASDGIVCAKRVRIFSGVDPSDPNTWGI